uniref:Uncharacterized protein n=1 Tax=Hyaloperonospora arabidopsidis (strain Emoy2) TaxID=559515 RepID=M4C3G3_HYAAE
MLDAHQQGLIAVILILQCLLLYSVLQLDSVHRTGLLISNGARLIRALNLLFRTANASNVFTDKQLA